MAGTQAIVQLLDRAHMHLATGHGTSAHRCAHAALVEARRRVDGYQEARALLALARAAVVESRLHHASTLALRVAASFERHGDVAGCAQALMVASYASAMLGRDGAAVTAAERCAGILAGSSPAQEAEALNYRGVAAFWSGDPATAARVLDVAAWWAGDATRADSPYQPLVNRAFAEVLVKFAPGRNGADADLLLRQVRQLDALHDERRTQTLGLTSVHLARCIELAVRAFAALAGGDDGRVLQLLGALDRATVSVDAHSWLHALPWWVRTVRAARQRSTDAACHAALQMEAAATRGENLALAQIAREHLAWHGAPPPDADAIATAPTAGPPQCG